MSALLNQIMFWVNVVTEKSNISDVQQFCHGGPRRIRTPDPLIRSQVLYPAELPVRVADDVICQQVRV